MSSSSRPSSNNDRNGSNFIMHLFFHIITQENIFMQVESRFHKHFLISKIEIRL